MLKKLIKYTDYNGVDRQENYYFNLNKAELLEMETEVTGGMRQLLENMMEKQDVPKIMKAFKTIIHGGLNEGSRFPGYALRKFRVFSFFDQIVHDFHQLAASVSAALSPEAVA